MTVVDLRGVDDFLEDITVSPNVNGLDNKYYMGFSLSGGTGNKRIIQSKTLSKGDFKHCRFHKIEFLHAMFAKTKFYKCIFQECDFRSCYFPRAVFENCRFLSCSFNHCRFELSQIINSKFVFCNGIESHFRNAEIKSTEFNDGEWEASFHGADLRWVKFSDVCLDSSVFNQTSFVGTRFDSCDLTNVPLYRADHKGAGALIGDDCLVYPWVSGSAPDTWSASECVIREPIRLPAAKIENKDSVRKAFIYSSNTEEFFRQ